MERRQDTLEDIRKRLGIDKLPEPRYGVGYGHQDPSTVKLWKALQLVDAIETASFERYIPAGVVIDLAFNPYSLTTENTFGAAIRTDVPIPSDIRVLRNTGIGKEPTAHHHYIWLSKLLWQHWVELEPESCSRPLVWRTYGGEDAKPMVGLIFHLSFPPFDRLNFGANWAVLTPKNDISSDKN